jgi:endonuclease III
MNKAISAEELGLNMQSGGEEALFGWFLASYLFGKRINQTTARRTWHLLFKTYGRTTPSKLCDYSWHELVRVLREGRYTRYDESTAERLLQICTQVQAEYGGRISGIWEQSQSRADFERRLLAFKGVGPKTLEIFMREAVPLLY